MFGKEPEFDPRSPVQPGRGGGAYFLLAIVAAIGIWAVQQYRPQDTSLTPTQSVAERSGAITGVFRPDDYPPEALDRNEQGTVNVRIDVDIRGRVSACTVLESSGYPTLDRATCKIIGSRARFQPAVDAAGKAVEASTTQKITWRIAG